MSEQRIILANSSRLLRDMFKRVLLKTENLEVVQEISDYQNMPPAIQRLDADWVILELPDVELSPPWVDQYMVAHPGVHFMTVSTDGSRIKTKWLECHEQEFTDLTLPEVIRILEE